MGRKCIIEVEKMAKNRHFWWFLTIFKILNFLRRSKWQSSVVNRNIMKLSDRLENTLTLNFMNETDQCRRRLPVILSVFPIFFIFLILCVLEFFYEPHHEKKGEKTAPARCPGVDGYLNIAQEITDLYPMTSSIWRRHQFLKSGKLRLWSINWMFLRLFWPYNPTRNITKFYSARKPMKKPIIENIPFS